MTERTPPRPLNAMERQRRQNRGKWIVLVVLLAVAAFLYAIIMVKIIKFGP